MTHNRLPAIVVSDSTLHDTAAIAGIALSRQSKIAIGHALDRAGVDEIELAAERVARGPAIDDIAAIAAMFHRAKPVLSGEMTRRLAEAAVRTGISHIHLTLPLAGARIGRSAVIGRIARVVGNATSRGLDVSVGGDNASGADFDLVCDAIAACEAAGAHRFRFVDSGGILDPAQTHAMFRQLCAETDLELEFRGSDECGLATANTLAAIQGGATHISVTMLRSRPVAKSRAALLPEVATAIYLSPLHHTRVWVSPLPALAALVAAATGAAADRDVAVRLGGARGVKKTAAGTVRQAAIFAHAPGE